MNFASDISADQLTTAEITFGDPVTSQLETGTDTDWFRVDLVQGERYVFDLAGVDGSDALGNPLLRLHQNGQLIAEDEGGGPGADSRILITAPETGTYYLEAASPAAQTGRYQLSATSLTQPTVQQTSTNPIDAIDWGTSIGTNTVDVYFAEQGESFGGHASFGWTDYEIGQTLAAMAEFEAVTNLTFNRVSSPDEADFKLVIGAPVFFSAVMYPPGEPNAGIGIFSRAALNADDGLEQGGTGFRILLHELAHGLGLAHPHDTGGDSVILNGVTSPYGDYGDFDLNQGAFTILSYNQGYASETGLESSRAYGNAGTLSPLDIALLQSRHGAREDANNDATTYELPSENSTGTFYAAIWDTGGIDQITHDGAADATIDLRAATLQYEEGGGGFVSRVDGIFGGYTIANGAVIENAQGGSGADTLIGNDAANSLNGGAGNDQLTGGLGLDVLTGGAGSDTFIFGLADDGAEITDFDNSDVLEFASEVQAATVFSTLSRSGNDATLSLNDTEIVLRDVGLTEFSLSGATITGSPLSLNGNPDLIFSDDLEEHSAIELFGPLRDFGGNLLGDVDAWQVIGSVDIQNDGDDEFILLNHELGRWATLGPDRNGVIDFGNHGEGGDTRVVGVYLDPLVEEGIVTRGSDFDSAQRFRNDLENLNLELLGAGDYDNDGLQQVYFRTVDGTAYLHALMHADGNIRYANYQSESQLIDYLSSVGHDSTTYGDWIV